MKFRQSLVLLPAIALTACSGGNDSPIQTMKDPTTPGSVVYAYPADGQTEVSPRADLILRFSLAVTDEPDALADKILVTADGNPVSFAVSKIDDGRSLKLTPTEDLAPGAEYTVSFTEDLAAGERSIPNPNATGPEGIQFTTRGALSGISGAASLDDEFAVVRMIPAEDSAFLPMDFSTFRLQLTQPVHPDWQRMGGTVELLDSDGEPVNASVLVRERAITIDPCLTDTPDRCGREEDLLTPGATYTIRLSGLPGLYGGTLSDSFEVTPTDTSPNVVLYQRIIDSGLNAGESSETAQKSVLNGQIINGITLESVLQGNAGPSQQTADLYAQLAYAPSFEGDIGVPLRIARNSKLLSTSLDIRINGLVPAIDQQTGEVLKTGDIKVTMLSDATGYLLPNPYTESRSAPRHVRLWMDIAMSTEEAMPNAALSQDIMGLELAGIAQVEDGLLTIDAIGMVEPNLLGMENTESTIAFRIQADTSVDVQMNAEDNREMDTTGPELLSWMPGPADDPAGNRQELQRPGDPVILYFDEPLDRDTVADGITLIGDGVEYRAADGNLDIRVDGTTVIVNPLGSLQHGVEYTLDIAGSVADLAGNGAVNQQLNFALPQIDDATGTVRPASPMILTSFPGFPCTTEGRDLTANPPSHGFCIDKPSVDPDLDRPVDQPRDELPLATLSPDRPITLAFSQSMNLDSINPQTFIVESVSAADAESIAVGDGTPVPGRLVKAAQRVSFIPDEPWSPGQLYRYALISEQGAEEALPGNVTEGSAGICAVDGSNPGFICGSNGLALQTDLLINTQDIGGEDLVIYFLGSASQGSVLTALRNLPVRDTNSNFIVDCNIDENGIPALGDTDCLEPFTHQVISEASAEPDYMPTENAAKLLSKSGIAESSMGEFRTRVGCPTARTERDSDNTQFRIDLPDCPERKFIYQTMGLNTEVIGRATDPETGKEGVEVMLHPSLLVTSSIDVFVELTPGDVFVLESRSATGPQVLRMRYAKDDPECTADCSRTQPIPGIIIENEDGKPVFKTQAELMLDAPALTTTSTSNGDPIPLDHNLFSYPFTLNLSGEVQFFDDGRMKISQLNAELPADITVTALALGAVDLEIPLEIPINGLYLNFISNPVKSAPTSE